MMNNNKITPSPLEFFFIGRIKSLANYLLTGLKLHKATAKNNIFLAGSKFWLILQQKIISTIL